MFRPSTALPLSALIAEWQTKTSFAVLRASNRSFHHQTVKHREDGARRSNVVGGASHSHFDKTQARAAQRGPELSREASQSHSQETAVDSPSSSHLSSSGLADRAPFVVKRFPPLIDMLVSDSYKLSSDPPEEAPLSPSGATTSSGTAARRYDVCDADHSLVRLSYNPKSAKVYLVRVPAVLRSEALPAHLRGDSLGSKEAEKTMNAVGGGYKGGDEFEMPALIRDVLSGREEATPLPSSSSSVSMRIGGDSSRCAQKKTAASVSAKEAMSAPHALHIVSDVESKAVMRLSPHHIAGMLSAMDEDMAGRCYAFGKTKGGGGGVGDSERFKLASRMRRQMGMDRGEARSSATSKPSAMLSAGRDPFAPMHFDDDANTYWLMRGAEMKRAVTSDDGGLKKEMSKPQSHAPSIMMDPVAGPRELQWFISEAKDVTHASEVTLISTLTTRQFVLHTTGTFVKLNPKKWDPPSGPNAIPRMRLRSLKLTGHAVDDSLLFFHCFGRPRERQSYSPIGIYCGANESDERVHTATSAVPPTSRKRIWSPIFMTPEQALPFKSFLESSLDEALGFGRTDTICYFGGSQTAPRLVAPQSIIRHSTSPQAGQDVEAEEIYEHGDGEDGWQQNDGL